MGTPKEGREFGPCSPAPECWAPSPCAGTAEEGERHGAVPAGTLWVCFSCWAVDESYNPRWT